MIILNTIYLSKNQCSKGQIVKFNVINTMRKTILCLSKYRYSFTHID